MLKNFLFVLICLCILTSCDFNRGQTTSASSFEKGKIYLADADRLRIGGDDIEAKKIYKKAILEFENAVKENVDQEGLALMLAQCQYRIRDFDNAIQWINKVISKNKDHAVAQQYFGYCLINKTKIPEAEKAFRIAFFNDKSGELKKEIINELTDIGELSLSLGTNFVNQGSVGRGTEFKKLGMRILALGLEYSKYDLEMAKQIQVYANELGDQIIIDWIANVIDSELNKTTTIQIQR